MKKFCRKKIAIALACSSILGGKSSTTLYPQTVEAAGRSVESSSKGLVNWVKNHKWPVIGGASAFVTAAIVSAVLGVKYLGKKDQKNPDEHEEKVDGKNKGGQKNPAKKDENGEGNKNIDKNKDEEKGEFFENNQEMIKNVVCTIGMSKDKVLEDLEKLKAKLKVWTKGSKQLEDDLTVAEINKLFGSNEEWSGKLYVDGALNDLRNIFSGKVKLSKVTASVDGFGRFVVEFSLPNFVTFTLKFTHQGLNDTFILQFNKSFNQIELRFKF